MLQVGDEGSFVTELELRSSVAARSTDRADAARMGLRFINPPGDAQKLVQRYILKVERGRRSRDLDLGD
jgi:c-di-GMP-binding flagellar brake protein YcgR